MASPDQLDIVEIKPGIWRLDFDYNPDFISFLKSRVPAELRRYDPATHYWEVTDPLNKYLPAIEGVGVQKFSYAMKKFRREGKLVIKNLQSHQEHIQEELF